MNIKELKQDAKHWYICPFCSDHGKLDDVRDDHNAIIGFRCMECDSCFELDESGRIQEV